MKKTLGLTEQQVLESRRRHGDNVLTPPPRKSLWKLFLEKFDDPLIKILLVALMLSVGISIYELVHLKQGAEVLLEPLGIVIAVVLATLVGFLVEVNANKKFDLLNRTNDDVLYKVMRTGHVTQVPRRDIVVGDIVILDTGERVPADGRLTQSVSMSVDESSLTGEPMARKSHQVDQAEQKGHESTYPVNMLLRGSTVSEGNGVMEVTAVGDATEYGKVFTDCYVIAALIIVGRTVAFYFDDNPDGTLLYQVQYFIQTIMLAVTLVVVSVPEGLPMSVTLSLALSMRRMLKTNNLVRRMHACETMGATTVICTDKTGTLTQNQMQVVASHFETQEARSERQGAEGKDDSQLIVDVSIACNTTAYLDDSDSNRVIALGNPTEGALLLWLNEQDKDYLALREQYRIVDRMPFSTERKYMASVVKLDDVDRVLLVKGAPEIVIDMTDIDPAKRREAQATLEQYQLKAMRTLAFAYVPLDASAEGCELADMLAKLQGQMHYLGFVAISDPVREQVPLSIQDCRNAGIRVKMVTGDNAATAREIARQSGIWTDQDNESNIITGPEFAALADDDAAQAAQRVKVMARARPSDKARLVSLLQAQDEVVAVTGNQRCARAELGASGLVDGRWHGSGQGGQRHHHPRQFVHQHQQGCAVGPVAISQHSALHSVPAHSQRLRLPGGSIVLVLQHTAGAPDSDPDAVGQPHHGHVCSTGAGFTATQQHRHAASAASCRRAHHHALDGLVHCPGGRSVCRGDDMALLHIASQSGWPDAACQLRLSRGVNLFLDVCLLAVLEPVQCQVVRQRAQCVPQRRGQPRVLCHCCRDPGGTGADCAIWGTHV